MGGAGAALQAAAAAAVRAITDLSVFDGPPVQAGLPYTLVESGAESEWGAKGLDGREVRLIVLVRDEGERPARVQALAAKVEAAVAGISAVADWQLANLRVLRSRLVKERSGQWLATIEFRARMVRE